MYFSESFTVTSMDMLDLYWLYCCSYFWEHCGPSCCHIAHLQKKHKDVLYREAVSKMNQAHINKNRGKYMDTVEFPYITYIEQPGGNAVPCAQLLKCIWLIFLSKTKNRKQSDDSCFICIWTQTKILFKIFKCI